MSITPEFLDELRSRLVLSGIVGQQVTFDRRKSNPRKRDFWACCPFHSEKSPSFHVDDDKGRYYCFGCGAKGDAITFLMETRSLAFREAVEELAQDAGLPVPAPTPQARKQEQARASLGEALAFARRFFRDALEGPAGQRARTYLEERGLDPAVRERFGLGYAPAGGVLIKALEGAGIGLDLAFGAGLAGRKDPDRPPYDYFRDRVIFPISDNRGRTIGFGGRVLDRNVEPKYLNSPETEVFHKGRVLYNLDRAREASRQADKVILAEGYMDVIAFDRAGLHAAMAPLGTAVTAEQLDLAWRLSQEPVLCFDGDEAGLRAAHRTLDLALPLISPERTLRFALLPSGQDPDDILRDEGAGGLRSALEKTLGVADLLWRRELAGGPLDTPERRAGFEKRLNDAVGQVADVSLRYHFERDIRARTRDLFRPAFGGSQKPYRSAGPAGRPGGGQGRFNSGKRGGAGRSAPWQVPSWHGPLAYSGEGPSPGLRASRLAGPQTSTGQGTMSADRRADFARRLLAESTMRSQAREADILAHALCHPWLLTGSDGGAEQLAALDFHDRELGILRDAILEAVTTWEGSGGRGMSADGPEAQDESVTLDRDKLYRHLSAGVVRSVLSRVLENDRVRATKLKMQAISEPAVAASWTQALSWHHHTTARQRELRSALDGFLSERTAEAEAWLIEICRQVHGAHAGEKDRT